MDMQDMTTGSTNIGSTGKKRLLTVLGAKIRLLREQLKATEREYDSLIAELAQNCSSNYPSTDPNSYINTGITSLPTEVLLDIFELSLLGHPRHITDVLRVCKRWHEIIMDEPHLWTNISITLTLSKAENRQELAYYDLCIKRSRDKPLSVSINGEKIRQRPIYPNGGKIVGADPTDAMDPTDTNYSERLWLFIRGDNDANIKRYRQLHLNINPGYEGVVHRFYGPLFLATAPNLTILALPHALTEQDLFGFVSRCNIKVFSTLNTYLMYFMEGSLQKVTTLDLGADSSYFEALSKLPLLNSLTLRNKGYNSHFSPRHQVQLSRLIELKLIGTFDDEIIKCLNLPILSQLTLIGDETFKLPYLLETQPKDLIWEDSSTNVLSCIGCEFTKELGCFLSKFDSINTITIPSIARHLVMSTLADLCRDGMVLVEVSDTRLLDNDSLLLSVNIHPYRSNIWI
jgi:hypothetical protein